MCASQLCHDSIMCASQLCHDLSAITRSLVPWLYFFGHIIESRHTHIYESRHTHINESWHSCDLLTSAMTHSLIPWLYFFGHIIESWHARIKYVSHTCDSFMSAMIIHLYDASNFFRPFFLKTGDRIESVTCLDK